MKNLIESIAYKISAENRQRKFLLFINKISPKKEETILDVGVNNEEYSESDNYLEKHYPFPEQITAVSNDGLGRFKKKYSTIKAVCGDGLNLPFQDNEFSISYSNAVIEHVGTHEHQLHFLKELVRVGRRGFLTTPNRYFPIEVHTRIPLLHIILPKRIFDIFLRKIGKGWATGDYMNLLSYGELVSLCKGSGLTSYDIIRNRMFGFTVTFTVIWNKLKKS